MWVDGSHLLALVAIAASRSMFRGCVWSLALLDTLTRSHGALSSVPPPASSPSDFSVRYFAYGANLAASVREGRRGLSPLSSEPGFVRGERLAFNVPGMGPAEPAFASIQKSDQPDEECHGGCFELTVADWLKVCATEGVPFAYRVRSVNVNLYNGQTVPAFTLDGNGLPFQMPPSARYLALIREGARELQLSRAWQDKLAEIQPAPFGSQPSGNGRAEPFENRDGETFV